MISLIIIILILSIFIYKESFGRFAGWSLNWLEVEVAVVNSTNLATFQGKERDIIANKK
jgi:hypothetical protein